MGSNECPSAGSANPLAPTQAEPAKADSRVMILAGPTETPFTLSTSILEASDFFRTVLSDRWLRAVSGGTQQPIRVDCEAELFAKIVRLMQYGSFAALPADMAPDEVFRLEQEVNYFGISVPDFPRALELRPMLDPQRLALVTWQATNYTKICCGCQLRSMEACWLVSLFYCYIFCAQCNHAVSLPEDLLLKVLAVAEGTKRQRRMLPEAGLSNKYRNGLLARSSVFPGLVQIKGLEGWKCLACSASSFAVCPEPFHAFCTECHTRVTSIAGVPKSQGLVGKLWLLGEEAARTLCKERTGEEGLETLVEID